MRPSRTAFGVLLALMLAACGASDAPAQSEPSPTNGAEHPPGDEPAGAAGEGSLVVGTDACSTDADCVPAGCCHPSACVAVGNAPACEDVMCTMDCRADTLDCGGSCLCHEGRCAARLMPGGALR